MSPHDLALLTPHLQHIDMPVRLRVETPNEDITHAYFMNRGIVSVVAHSAEHESIEAGLIGWEGVTATSVVLGNHTSPHEAFVQLEGEAQRIKTDALRDAFTKSESLRQLLLHFVNVFSVQVTHTALANGRANIEERLARWLLMAHDRIEGDDVTLTHDFIATMLGVRRAGVTDALHALEGRACIRSTRGAIRIVDREGLETLAGGAYGAPEAAYQRLIAQPKNTAKASL